MSQASPPWPGSTALPQTTVAPGCRQAAGPATVPLAAGLAAVSLAAGLADVPLAAGPENGLVRPGRCIADTPAALFGEIVLAQMVLP